MAEPAETTAAVSCHSKQSYAVKPGNVDDCFGGFVTQDDFGFNGKPALPECTGKGVKVFGPFGPAALQCLTMSLPTSGRAGRDSGIDTDTFATDRGRAQRVIGAAAGAFCT